MAYLQYAVEEKIIVEAMVHGIRSAVQKFVSQDLVLLEVDLRNAFNCIYRATMLTKLPKCAPVFSSSVHFQ